MLPSMVKIHQKFQGSFLKDLKKCVEDQLRCIRIYETIRDGDKIGIAIGSRGIDELRSLLEIVVNSVLSLNARPFFIPAMGSHGGADPDNQVLIVREIVGDRFSSIPVIGTTEVVELGKTTSGVPVFFSSGALEMDKVFLINRIKPHTDFRGKIGSGLLKMLTIGLGKHKGAEVCHIAAGRVGLERVIREAAATIFCRAPIALGFGLVENAYGQIAELSVVTPDKFAETDEAMLLEATKLSPKLPFEEIHILIVNEIGKDISGNGMDTNIIGRYGESDVVGPKIDWIFVRDITPKTRGNATGIGLADVTTKRLVDDIDLEATKINCLTSLGPELGRIPVSFENDYDALNALVNMKHVTSDRLKIVWIKNTSDLEECLVSTAYQDTINQRHDLEQVGQEVPLRFNLDGWP